MIRARGITKIFGDNPDEALRLLGEGRTKDEIRAETGQTVGVNNVSFELEPGEFFVIMGLSGSGKSTLLRCINRLIEPTTGQVFLQTPEGEIEVTGLNSAGLRDVRSRQMSMVFQRFGLFPHMTVLDNVAYGLEVQGRPKNERRSEAQEKLDMVGLGEWGDAYPSELSGGMQQRVGLARALATGADILLMDEPFSALDPLIKMQMQDEMINIQRELHRTILFITHDLDEALRLGDRIAIMESGSIVQMGTPEDIIVNPRTEYVADFVEHADPTGVITAGTIALPLGHERLIPSGTKGDVSYYSARMRPELRFGVHENGDFVGVLLDGQPLETKRLEEVLAAETPPEVRRRDVVLICPDDANLKHVLRGRIYSSLPLAVVSPTGELRGIITERELVQGILEKRGHQDVQDSQPVEVAG
ncbi:MAG TPA: glycine betaine/L-proline ABC transporter ATP-binding protein [Trueperaceae bacterium]